MDQPKSIPELVLLSSQDWRDYELLDSGGGQKLERYGPYIFIRPEHQAIWKPSMGEKKWGEADAIFQPTGEESGGYWKFNHPIVDQWIMQYKALRFQVQASPSRHMGVFPEQAVHWDWIKEKILQSRREVHILNLFGYTGLASLTAAQAGARVTHVDASKKAIQWARLNQSLSGLQDCPVRWLVDDVVKFVRREIRRGVKYDGIILDPPKFGRGPSGQVWEYFEAMPELIQNCRILMGEQPLFILITAYAIRASALSIYYALSEIISRDPGNLSAGELVLQEKSRGRLLSMAIFARWASI